MKTSLMMSSLRIAAAATSVLCLTLACAGEKKDDGFGPPIELKIQPEGDGPSLDAWVAFPASMDPGPHVSTLAGAFHATAKRCAFEAPVRFTMKFKGGKLQPIGGDVSKPSKHLSCLREALKDLSLGEGVPAQFAARAELRPATAAKAKP